MTSLRQIEDIFEPLLLGIYTLQTYYSALDSGKIVYGSDEDWVFKEEIGKIFRELNSMDEKQTLFDQIVGEAKIRNKNSVKYIEHLNSAKE